MASYPDPRDQHHHHATVERADEAMAELLDLDGEVLHSYLSEVTAWMRDLASYLAPRRILDVGSGTGTGTFALLERFALAKVIALDISMQLLGYLKDRARSLGVADRVSTVHADLDGRWPTIGSVDLAWASSSLHHMADPDHALSETFKVLRPGGLLFVAEMDSFPRFLPDDLGLGRPGLEERVHAVLAKRQAGEVPHLGADWGPRLSKAGFTIEAERRFTIDLTETLPASSGRYAQVSLQRLRSNLDNQLCVDDLVTLDTIIESDGPDGILQRTDLTVRSPRTVWVARHPLDT